MSFLSVAQKSAIKARAAVESSSRVAQAYGISRARVRQIAKEDPETWRDYRDLPENARRWKPKGLTSDQIREILASAESHVHLARRFGVSLYQIQRLRHAAGMFHTAGLPRTRVR